MNIFIKYIKIEYDMRYGEQIERKNAGKSDTERLR